MCVSKYIKICIFFVSNEKIISNLNPRKVVDRGSLTQLQVGAN